MKQRSTESFSGIWLKNFPIAVQHCKTKRGTLWYYRRVNVTVPSVSHQGGQTSASVLWSSSASESHLAEWEEHSSTNVWLSFLKHSVQNSNLVPCRHISGAHPPINRSKELWMRPKIVCQRGRDHYIFSKKQDIRDFVSLHLMSGIWCQHFRNKTTKVVWVWLFLYIILAVSGIIRVSTITGNKVCLYCHKYFAKTGKVEYFELCRSCKCRGKRDPAISVLKTISNSLCVSCALSNPLNVKSPTQFGWKEKHATHY